VDQARARSESKRVLILGIDGYIGHALAQRLLEEGHCVGGVDAGLRRKWVKESGSDSATEIASPIKRFQYLVEHYDNMSPVYDHLNIATKSIELRNTMRSFSPDVVFHLAHQPSAPFSMIDQNHAKITQSNNLIGGLNVIFSMQDACPNAHLITIGTMGEYGTPAMPVPEGDFPDGSTWESPLGSFPIEGSMFPKDPGSFYHLSKAYISMNTRFACKIWGLTCTDVMQGIVYGFHSCGPDPGSSGSISRLDVDHCFGTVIHRLVAQATNGFAMTVHGTGLQTRGFLHIDQSVECLNILMENPPRKGEYRVVNQFAESKSILDLVEIITDSKELYSHPPIVSKVRNPRIESEDHIYEVDCSTLANLGFTSSMSVRAGMRRTLVEFGDHARVTSDMSIQLGRASVEWKTGIINPVMSQYHSVY
jgi:UDP-sulfoquinovose synthase